MLVVSIISFHTMDPVQSALVVGSNRIDDILYNPTPNQIKFRAKKINFGICTSAFCSSMGAKVLFKLKIPVRGVMIAPAVMEILKIFKCLPDIESMKAFIMICCPGLVANDMALEYNLACRAFCCCVDDVMAVASVAVTLLLPAVLNALLPPPPPPPPPLLLPVDDTNCFSCWSKFLRPNG